MALMAVSVLKVAALAVVFVPQTVTVVAIAVIEP
jgi:hypothetical protein